MPTPLDVLQTSVARLRSIVEPLDDDAITAPAYPSEWSIAQVVSHLGSAAIIFGRRLDDGLAGRETPDDFAPTVWAEWDAKSPRAMVDDGLAADAALLARLEGLDDAERAQVSFSMGPLLFDFEGFVGLRVNEHVVHTWDVEVALDPTVVLPGEATDLLVDQLGLVAGFTARPAGEPGTTIVDTTEPARRFAVTVADDGATFSGVVAADAQHAAATADLALPAESMCRLVYGRLDPDHTPAGVDDGPVLARLRAVFPGA